MAKIHTTNVFDAWFDGLRDRQAQLRITARIRRLSIGNPGQSRNLAGGVAEMKIDYGPGYRVYYTEHDGITYVLLCGGDKTSQQHDINTARAMAARLSGRNP